MNQNNRLFIIVDVKALQLRLFYEMNVIFMLQKRNSDGIGVVYASYTSCTESLFQELLDISKYIHMLQLRSLSGKTIIT